jgi:hypothetical protein
MATVSGTQRQLTHTSNTYESNGSLTIGGNLNINGSGTVDGRDIAVDGVKLDGIATGANNYSLPSGTSSARGGFKIGYSENGKNYPVEVLSEQMFVNVPWTDANTVYTHPTQSALTVDVNANSAATILSTLDIAVNTLGHVTSASSTTRTLTAADLGVAAGANNYSLPSGTSSARGGFKIGYSENGKNYPVEVLSEQMFVNVPWTDANTVYTHPTQSALTVDVNANSAATILSTLDIAVNTLGHVTSASSTTRTLTAADLGVAAGANNYSLPSGTSSARGGFKIGYSENGKNYPVEVLSEQMFVNVPWTDANTVYTHPTQSALTVDVNANSAATILSTLDIAVNTLGHVTSASSTTRTLTAADLGVAAGANNYSLPSGTSSARGGFKIGYSENGKNYPVEVLSEQMFVNVPWTDANTTYSAGTHLSLSGTTFNLNLGVADAVLNIGHNSIADEGEIVLDTSNAGSPQISFTEHGDASWAIGVDDADNSFKIHGVATSVIPTINGLATPLFEIATNGLGYLGANRLFADNYHPNADTLTTARTISLAGAVTGSVSFNGSSNVSITTTATADPTLTLSGDATGSATFTNLGNATLSVSVVNDSHTHTKLSGFPHQVEYDLIRAGNYNGLCMKARWDGATTNRYWDMGHVDGSGTFTSGLKVFNNGNLTYKGNTVFHDTYHPNADTLTTARTISLAGAVTGSVSFNGSSNVSITTTATADPTLTLSGDASGSATFTNLGNATLSVTIADDSHNHTISNIDGLQVALDAKAPLANPALTGIPTAPTPSAGTSSTQIATTAFVNSYFVSNRLETPVQNFNPWGVNRFYHGVETNRFHGRSEFLSLSVDGGSASAPSIYLTDGGYEGSAGVYGTVGGSDVVLLYDFETNGLTGGNGFTYSSGQFHIHFYPGRNPTAISARVKHKDGSYYAMTMTGYKEYNSGNYISWRGTVPIYNYAIAVEFTLTPQGSGGNTISLTELEYHGDRMGLSEGGLLTKNGGDIFGNLNVTGNVDASGLTLNAPAGYHPFIIKSNGVEQVRFANTGNVGIGTTSPGSILHMVGTSPEVRIASADGQTARLGLYEDTAGTQHGGYIQYVGSGDTLRLGIVNSGANTDVITVTDTFNVGIGTTSPSAKLDVNGEVQATSLDINGAADISGNLTVGGTVDGRDVAVDGVKLDGVATGANNYSLPSGTSSARGGFKIGYSENGKNYPVEVLSEQMFVNVPWTDANTTYSAGSGISLSSTTFSVAAGDGLTQTATGLSHTDTSSQGSINNSNGTVIQDVTLDTYGHVTSIGSYNLDSRYYTETESDGRYLRNSVANSLTNVLTISEASNGNIVYDLANNGVYIPKPIGASYHTLTNVHTGAIAIKLPTTSWNNSDMVSFHVDIYDYAGDTNGESVTLYIYGYHQGALSWANVGAVISSTLPDKDYTVRFGHDGTRPIVWIGETTSVWNFPQISVRDFQAGNTANHLSYDSGWEVVPNATSFGTISKTSTGNYPYAKAIIGPIYTVASGSTQLPSASPAGQRGFISDSSGELATSHGAVAFGGGSTTIPVYSDGSSWRIG